MKIKIIFTMLFWLLAISINAQQPLYRGITSGMTKNEFTKYVNSQTDLKWTDNKEFIEVTIKDRLYLFSPDYNEKGKVKMLLFFSMDSYEWYDYDKVEKNAVELFRLLSVSYGDPTYDNWPAWTEIIDEEPTITCVFLKESVGASIVVSKRSDLFYVSLIVMDTDFVDKEPQSSEGF